MKENLHLFSHKVEKQLYNNFLNDLQISCIPKGELCCCAFSVPVSPSSEDPGFEKYLLPVENPEEIANQSLCPKLGGKL